MASIVKRNNSYCVVYTYKHTNGTLKQKWETFTDLADAKNRKKEVEYKESVGTFVAPPRRTPPAEPFYPVEKFPADQELYLKGFKWEGARRPTQGAVFDRRVRPSQREEKSHLAHPDFPLLKALEERKKQLIEERRWADRNDQVDAATVEWMRALGFEVGQPRESGPKL